MVTLNRNSLTDTARPRLDRPDARSVLVVATRGETPDLFAEPESWPAGLLSVTLLTGMDDDAGLLYTQWDEPDAEFLRQYGEPVEYQRYRSGVRDAAVPGCVVVVQVEFDGPDPQRQRQWVDTVFAALASEETPAPGGISGHFHASTDGTRVLNYAEWTDAQAHRDALARSEHGTVGVSAKWQEVREFPGVRGSEVRRYQVARSMSR